MSDKYSHNVDATDPRDGGLEPPEQMAMELADHELNVLSVVEMISITRIALIQRFVDMPEDRLRKLYNGVFNRNATWH